MREALVEARQVETRIAPREAAFHPDERDRSEGDSDVAVRQREGAEVRDEEPVTDDLRERVGAEEDPHEHAHEDKRALLLRLESETPGQRRPQF